MKRISQFLHSKKIEKKASLDDGSLLYVFNKVIREEYGNRGVENLKLDSLKGKNLFIKTNNVSWEGVLRADKDIIASKINSELGSQEIGEILI